MQTAKEKAKERYQNELIEYGASLHDLALSDLHEMADNLYDQHAAAKDKNVRKDLRTRYNMVADMINVKATTPQQKYKYIPK